MYFHKRKLYFILLPILLLALSLTLIACDGGDEGGGLDETEGLEGEGLEEGGLEEGALEGEGLEEGGLEEEGLEEGVVGELAFVPAPLAAEASTWTSTTFLSIS